MDKNSIVKAEVLSQALPYIQKYNSKIVVGFRIKSFRIAAHGDFAIGYIGPYGVHISASGITEKKIDGHADYPYQK